MAATPVPSDDRGAPLRASAPLLLGGLLFGLGAWLTRPAEDAVILYEYARNLAETGVITYGGATTPIEGATDFLWMVIIAALSAVGVDEFLASLLLSGVAAGGLFRAFAGQRRALLGLLSVALLPFSWSALAGFSPLMFSLVFVALLQAFFARRHGAFYALALALCLIRPDGVVYALGPASALFFGSLRGGRWREVGQALGILVLPGLLYFVGRAAYFGELLPLPFLVKGSGGRDLLFFYTSSLVPVFSVALPLAVAALATRSRDTLMEMGTLLAAPVLFFCAMRLEQNLGNRFLAPLGFGGLFLLARSHPRAAWSAFAAVALLTAKDTVTALAYHIDSHKENVFDLAQALAEVDGRMSVTEAGRLAYYSGWEVHDTWGLNTPDYARNFVSLPQLEAGEYDLMNAHCKLQMLIEPPPLSTERSWDHQCAALTRFMGEADYEIWLVPFATAVTWRHRLKGWDPQCRRHDLYAVRRTYSQRDRVVEILQDHGAIPWSPELTIQADRVCLD